MKQQVCNCNHGFCGPGIQKGIMGLAFLHSTKAGVTRMLGTRCFLSHMPGAGSGWLEACQGWTCPQGHLHVTFPRGSGFHSLGAEFGRKYLRMRIPESHMGALQPFIHMVCDLSQDNQGPGGWGVGQEIRLHFSIGGYQRTCSLCRLITER